MLFKDIALWFCLGDSKLKLYYQGVGQCDEVDTFPFFGVTNLSYVKATHVSAYIDDYGWAQEPYTK